jgi:VCBS repeat-containing protein
VTVSITVAAGNDAPVAMPDAYEIAEGGTLTIPAPGVLANDSDIDGTPLTAVLMGGASNGTVVLGPDGSLVYTPDADFNGIATFTYAAFDGTSNSNVATVTILVTAANDVPVAAADSYSTPEDGELAVDAEHGVLSNDADVEGTPLKAILVGQASHGVVTLNEDGSFTYVPAQNFNGTDTFSYKANDGEADSNVVDVTITADPVNDAPTAAGDSYPAQEDQALTIAAPGVLGNDSDIDGDPLTAIVVSGPQHGSLVLNSDGSFRYTPAANYAGDDSFTYKANDGNADSEVAAVSLTVTGANDAPVAASQSVTTGEDSPLPIVLSASDVDSDALAYSVVSGPSHGSLSGTAPNVVYTPAANYNGPDSFTFKANDGTADSNVATVSITVGGANDAPVAGDDSFSVAEDSMLTVAAPGVLGNDSDIDGNALHAVLATAPAHGTLSLNADGSFTYRPAANYSGADSFTYRANDGSVDSNVATVSITVTAGNDAPVAGNDAYSVAEDTTLTVATPGVLGNDTDSEGDPFTAALVSQPAHGTLTFSADGSFTYVPAANFNGADTFSYRAENASGSSNLATVTINVSAVNDAPKVDPILNQAGLVGKALSLQIVARDLDGDVLRYSATNLPAGLTLNADNGRISGTPLKSGTYVVTVTVSDGVSAVNTTFTWIIQAMKIVLAQPSDQISREGDHVSLGLETTLAERLGNEKRDFSAKNLPRGLRVSKAGEIRGHLKRDSAGVYKVSVTATLGNTSGSVQFNWTVADRDHRGSGDDGDDDSAYSCDRDDHDDEGGDDSSGKGGWDRL